MKYGFGIDLGGTTVKIAYFDETGKMLDKWEIPTVTEGGGFFTVLFGNRRYYIRSADVPEDSQLRELAGQKTGR